jgi:hypothetical protein
VFESVSSMESELGGVVVGQSRELLAGITISLRRNGQHRNPLTTKTNDEGKFHFLDIKPGLYTLRASRDGYADFSIDQFEIKTGQHAHISDPLEMLRCAAGVRCSPNRKIHVVEICL